MFINNRLDGKGIIRDMHVYFQKNPVILKKG